MNLADFVYKWKRVTTSETRAAKEHFIDLCTLLGERTPNESDYEGTDYSFEKHVDTALGGKGFADVWKRGYFGWEYKSKGEDLVKAYAQLLNYHGALDHPPLLVVCDLEHFEIHTTFTGLPHTVFKFSLDDLAQNQPTPDCALPPLDVLRAVLREPDLLKPGKVAETVTQSAATEFAALANSLRARGHHPEQAAHFLIRLLFCLFAEDVGLLPNHLFTMLVANTRERPDHFSNRLQVLFSNMATGGFFGAEQILHFNGGLFADSTVLELTRDDLTSCIAPAC
jgi:hypothetical protein